MHCNRRRNREFEVGHFETGYLRVFLIILRDFEDFEDTFLYFWRKRCCKIDQKSEWRAAGSNLDKKKWVLVQIWIKKIWFNGSFGPLLVHFYKAPRI